ncbi:MAG: cyclic-di-AMP receptor [Oscillospiraceae bacterium]|nr:cyclic-di-AMP receptor [Oscillospiraceae bacterium]
MKLILAIINKEDSQEVSHSLTKERYSVTKLATQGGFLMSGNITLIIGTEDEKVDRAIEIIKEHSRQRKEIVPSTATYGIGVTTSFPLEVTVGGATIFVLDVDRFEKA